MDSTQTPPLNGIIGICVRYCIDGVQSDVWVNMTAVDALAWGDKNVPEHYGKQSHEPGKKLPPVNEPHCAPIGSVETGICWYDGTKWICGD